MVTRYVLALSGGGVRGLYSLYILQKIEELLKKHENTFLYDKFDVFAGSSTGSLTISGIVYKKYTAAEIINQFYTEEVLNRIMYQSFFDKILGIIQTRPKFNDGEKDKLVYEILGTTNIRDTEKCVVIPLYDITDNKPVYANSKTDNYFLSDVVSASSAAPCYFPSVEYTPGKMAVDGIFAEYDPGLHAYLAALKEYPDDDIRVISIGTGITVMETSFSRETKNWGGIEWFTAKGGLADISMYNLIMSSGRILETLSKTNGHKYIKIDSELNTSSAMDDTDPKNLEYLKQSALSTFEKFEDQLKIVLFE